MLIDDSSGGTNPGEVYATTALTMIQNLIRIQSAYSIIQFCLSSIDMAALCVERCSIQTL
jgi:hypothetical protein